MATKITNIADLHALAKRKLPSIIYSYVAGGGYEEETLRRNRRDLESLTLLPRVLNDVTRRNMSTTFAGDSATFPVVLAPVGALGITCANGEVQAARAAKKFGVPFCLSTLSIGTIEDVAEATRAPFWFQLYYMQDKKVNDALLQRAHDAGCSALVFSMDLHVRSLRHREQKHGLGAPPEMSLANIWDGLTHPGWLLPMIGSKRRTFGNLVGLVPEANNVGKLTEWLENQFDPSISANTIKWLRKVWDRKLIVKGVLHPEEARMCAELGVDAIDVSNHGGRQVDGAASTASMLPRIVEATKGKIQVLVDSGIRSGMDILKMLGMGASGCLIGRAYVYGLAVGGEEGVTAALNILQTELDQTMGLCGVTDVHSLPDDLVLRPADFDREPVHSSPPFSLH